HPATHLSPAPCSRCRGRGADHVRDTPRPCRPRRGERGLRRDRFANLRRARGRHCMKAEGRRQKAEVRNRKMRGSFLTFFLLLSAFCLLPSYVHALSFSPHMVLINKAINEVTVKLVYY